MKKSNLLDSYLRNFTLILLFSLAFLYCYTPIEMGDSWWHLSSGRWIVENGKVPPNDIFSPIDPASSWILTQWLGSVTFYLAYMIGEIPGLKLFRALIFVVVFLIFFRRAMKYMPLALVALLGTAFILGVGTRCFIRPLIYNFIFIELFLIILFSHAHDPDKGKLFWVPVLSVFWFNIHLGSFVYGTAIIGIFFLSTLLKLANKEVRSDPAQYQFNLTKSKELMMVLGLHVLAMLATPYGIKGMLYPFQAIFDPNFINLRVFVDIVVEAQPPVYLFNSNEAYWIYALIFGGFAALWFNPQRSIAQLLLYVSGVFVFLYGERGSVYFVTTTTFVIIECLREMNIQEKWEDWKSAKVFGRMVTLIVIVLNLLIINQLFNLKFNGKTGLTNYMATERLGDYPDEIIAKLEEIKYEGVIFNMARYGSYLLWKMYPKVKPIVDGRQANQEIYLDYRATIVHPFLYFQDFYDKYPFKAVLCHKEFQISYYLERHEDWQLIHEEGVSQLFLHKDYE